jgi:DNA-binding transcriptional MerR regulator
MAELTDITEVVDHFGLALSTLRYWERRGLLTSHRRSGRRCYDTDQLYRIALIRHWRDTGMMSIKDIRAILTHSSASGHWTATVDGQIDAIDARIAALEAARGYLRHLRGCRHPGSPEFCPDFRALVELPR